MENVVAKKARTAVVLPTSEEQRQLQQLEILMKNNLLNLQAKELIKQIDSSSKLSGKKVVDFLSALDTDAKDTSKSSCHKRQLTVDWAQQQAGNEALQFFSSEECSIEYRSPLELITAGSYAIDTCVAPFYNIDILVTIPSKILDSKDILNHLYFDKRALFLTGLRKTLEKANKKNGDKYKSFSFEFLKGDLRKPVLCVHPSFSTSLVIRLIPVLPESCVKLAQLRYSKNNVRPQSWLDEIQKRKEQGIRADAKDMEVSSLPATPMYNAAIVEDIVMPLHKQILERTIHAFENVRGALMLLKVWLRQRQLVHSAIGFDMHTMSLMLAYLVQSKRVSTTAAPEIIFQAFLTFVTTFDRANQVLDFTTTGFVPRSQLSPEESNYSSPNGFVLRHPISLQPSSNGNLIVLYNIFWRVHDSAVTFLNNEAAKALQELSGSHRPGAFDRLFLQKRGFEDSFDQFFILQVPSWLEVINKVEYSSVESEEGENAEFLQQQRERLEHASLHWPVEAYFACEAYQLLRKALGDRITEMCVSVMPLSVGDADSSKNSSSKYPSFSSTQHSSYILIGIFLDKEKHFRKVERGPPAVPASEVSSRGESAAERAVREFKDFWGSKAQLRRFKDGSILESVVWEDTDFSPLSHDLIEDISRFILSRHLRAAIGDVTSVSEDNYDLLTSGHFWAKMGNLSTSELLVTPQPATSSSSMANNHPSFKPELKIVAAFDELRGVLVNKLQRVPLRIDSLLAYSPELRYSSMYPAEPHLYVQLKYLFTLDQEADYKPLIRQYVGCPFSLVTTPIPVIAKFEASSRWPTDAAAIQKCKSAFMLKIKEEIWNQSQVLSIIHEDSLDILIQGFIFRVYPMATFETERIALMSTAPTNLFLSDLTPSHYAVNCRYVIPPLHHSAMKSLHAQFPIFGETVKLMRLWLARHQFSGHLSQEAIECLVAMEFLHPSTTCAPTTTSAAFLRTLQLLVDFNWDEEPLVVDYSLIAGVSQDETEEERAKQAAKDASNPIAAAANLNVPMTTDIRTLIATRFRSSKTAMENLPVLEINPQQLIHPAMYIVTSADKVNEFEPMLKQSSPEKVVLNLMIQMAKLTISNIHSEYMVPSGIRIPQANDDDDSDNEVAEEESETQSVEHLGHFFQASSAVLKKCNVVLTFSEHLLAPERSIMVGGRRVVRNERDADSLQSGETGDEDDHSESDEIVGGVELTYRDVQAGPAFASTMLFANTGKNELDLSRLVVIANECRGHSVQAEVIQKLRAVFGPQAIFFWDETDGHRVGILWRPRFSRARPFAVMDCRYRTVFNSGKESKKVKNGKKRKVSEESDADEDSDDDSIQINNMQFDENGEPQTLPNYSEIIEHIIVVSRGLLQRK